MVYLNAVTTTAFLQQLWFETNWTPNSCGFWPVDTELMQWWAHLYIHCALPAFFFWITPAGCIKNEAWYGQTPGWELSVKQCWSYQQQSCFQLIPKSGVETNAVSAGQVYLTWKWVLWQDRPSNSIFGLLKWSHLKLWKLQSTGWFWRLEIVNLVWTWGVCDLILMHLRFSEGTGMPVPSYALVWCHNFGTVRQTHRML